MAKSGTYDEKTLADGSKNPKYVDLLDEDKPIANQKFACLSFVSPENVLKNREHHLFSAFLQTWDFQKSMEKYNQFLNFIIYKYNLDPIVINKDLMDFMSEEEVNLKKIDITDEYKSFLDKHEERLVNEFNEANEFQTSVRGLKVRGVYSTQAEAEARAKSLQ